MVVMNEEQLIKKLRGVSLPEADPAGHRRQLRAALLARGSLLKQSRRSCFSSLIAVTRNRMGTSLTRGAPRQRTWKLAAFCALAFIVVLASLAVAPFLEGQSPAAQAAEIACNSTEVKEALGGSAGQVLRVIVEGETSLVILRGAGAAATSGDIVVAEVDMTSRTVTSASRVSGSVYRSTYSDWDALIGSRMPNESDTIFLSTPLELRAICDGISLWSTMSVGEPEAVINDVTGDGANDLIVSSGPSVKCCDGATGESVWMFECGQRRVFEYGVGWGGEDLHIWSIGVLGSADAQLIVVHTDWQVFCICARNGEEAWRFQSPGRVRTTAVVPDQDCDGTDDLLIGTYWGDLCLLSGNRGESRWKRDIGAEWVENGELQHGAIVGIEIMDNSGREAAIGVGDGRVCLIELASGAVEWEDQVTFRELSNSLQIWHVSDVTGDERPDVLVSKGYVKEAAETSTSPDGVESVTMPLRTVVLLDGADGNVIWTAQLYTAGCVITVIDDEPVMLELHPELGITTISLRSGQIKTSLALPRLNEAATRLGLMSDGRYVVITEDGSLAALLPSGELVWTYSRLRNAEIQTGRFTPDAIPDLLVLGRATPDVGIRQLSVLDGVTRKEVWRYDVAVTGSGGVLRGVRVIDDLTGDGTEDILGWVGSTVLRLNGADGLVSYLNIDTTITSLESCRVGGSPAILACSGQGLTIIDGAGARLWGSVYAGWDALAVTAVEVLNDLNQDGTSELVLCSSGCISVVVSKGANPLDFGVYRSMNADPGKCMELKELTNDIDGDGVQEIACFSYDTGTSVADGVLLVVSPRDGHVWHRWDMPVTVDLACADLDGDGFQDSLLHRQLGFREVPTGSYYGQVYQQTMLEVYSGRDSRIVWAHLFDEDRWQAGVAKMPATPVGDVSGDGIVDLAVSCIVALGSAIGTATDSHGVTEARFLHETHVSIFNICSGALLKVIVLPQAQRDSQVVSDESHSGYFEPVRGPGDAVRLAGDLNGDGWQELAVLASYLPMGGHCLALVDLQEGRLLGYTDRLSTIDFFEASERFTVVFTVEGAVCLARLDSSLRVTSPVEGDVVGSRVRIAWEGGAPSSSTSLFVDGYESARTSVDQVVLPLTSGEHEVVIRSVDEFGTVTYAVVHFRAEGAPWALILACLSVIGLLVAYFAVGWARVMRTMNARR